MMEPQPIKREDVEEFEELVQPYYVKAIRESKVKSALDDLKQDLKEEWVVDQTDDKVEGCTICKDKPEYVYGKEYNTRKCRLCTVNYWFEAFK